MHAQRLNFVRIEFQQLVRQFSCNVVLTLTLAFSSCLQQQSLISFYPSIFIHFPPTPPSSSAFLLPLHLHPLSYFPSIFIHFPPTPPSSSTSYPSILIHFPPNPPLHPLSTTFLLPPPANKKIKKTIIIHKMRQIVFVLIQFLVLLE